ncbi:hypothetical protein AB0M79_19415 [Polymorphospora sp. NPDC051019]|uniref:hypothetical protein n=1 Tax=Polymorphospora sp. NPDC051019 TaxID=3155725 RepID=UPI0034205D4D
MTAGSVQPGGGPAPLPPPAPAASHPPGSVQHGDLAARQAELVAALVAGAPVPAGFDERLVGIARGALLRKRAGDVARHWPLLAAGLGTDWTATFARFAATRPTRGSLRDGWDLARDLHAAARLTGPARDELAAREATWHYRGTDAPRPRRLPALRRGDGTVVIQFAGRVHTLTLPGATDRSS